MTTTISVLDLLEAQLGSGTVETLSRQLGTDTAATSHAVTLAVPILLGRLSKNASDADGAAALDTALNAHDGGVLDDLSNLSGGSGIGAAILKHVLGSRRGSVEEGVGKASGLNLQQAGQLLALLAPLVMGVLGRMKAQHNLTANELPVVLGQANLDMSRQSTAVGDLSRVLDSDQDGEIAGELERIGTSIVGGVLGPATSA
jgi:hypothetical protein